MKYWTVAPFSSFPFLVPVLVFSFHCRFVNPSGLVVELQSLPRFVLVAIAFPSDPACPSTKQDPFKLQR